MKGRAIGQVLADSGAFLKNVDLFDHMEFGVTSKDARVMPLSTRKLIETTFLSLCDSGIDYRGRNVGCYMSGVAHDTFSVSGHVGEVFLRRSPVMLTRHCFRMTLKLPDPFRTSHPWSPTGCPITSIFADLLSLWTPRAARACTRRISPSKRFGTGSAKLPWSADVRSITGGVSLLLLLTILHVTDLIQASRMALVHPGWNLVPRRKVQAIRRLS